MEYFECAGRGADPLKYFEHSIQLAEGIGAKAFRKAYGLEGYGRYYRLLELIAGARKHIVNLNDSMTVGLTIEELNFESQEDFRSFIQALQKCGLIRFEDGFIWSEIVHESAGRITAKSAGGKKSKPYTRKGRDEQVES